MKEYDKIKESSYLKYLDINKEINKYGKAFFRNIHVHGFKWTRNKSKFNKDFIKIYNEVSDIRYLLEVHVQYPEKLCKLQNDLTFLPKRMKIVKIEKLIAYLYVATNPGLALKFTVIKFNQEVWLKSYIGMNTELRKRNDAVFGKTIGNVRKHEHIKLVTTKARKNYLVLEPNYHTTNFFQNVY